MLLKVKKYFRPTEVDILKGDYSKAQDVFGWKPKTKFKDLVKIMVSYDYSRIKKILMLKDSSIYVAGHNGMVGSAIVRLLLKSGYKNIITKSSKDLDLTNQADVDIFFSKIKPDFVFIAAAKVGGIFANNLFRADFIYDNIMIQSNLINACKKYAVKNGVSWEFMYLPKTIKTTNKGKLFIIRLFGTH